MFLSMPNRVFVMLILQQVVVEMRWTVLDLIPSVKKIALHSVIVIGLDLSSGL